MRERHRSLERLLLVKMQLHSIEEARLNEIRRQRAATESDKRDLFDILGDIENNDALVLGLACRHLVHSEKRESELAAKEQAQKAQLLQRTAQKKTLEKIVAEIARAVERDDEKRELLDIGEKLAEKARSSLG
jgi:hypothetical protein